MGCLLELVQAQGNLFQVDQQKTEQGIRRYRPPKYKPLQPKNKRPQFLSTSLLNSQLLQNLWQVIMNDDDVSFLDLLQSGQIRLNVQAGPPQSWWTIVHLCCRWNSVRCLDLFCKLMWANQSQSLYKQALNSQQKDGYDALMICGMFRSNDCLLILLDLGGHPLTNTDKLGRNCVQILMMYGADRGLVGKIYLMIQNGQKIIPLNQKKLSYLPEVNLSQQKIKNFIQNKKQSNQQSQAQLQKARKALLLKMQAEKIARQKQALQKKQRQQQQKKKQASLQNQTSFPVNQFPTKYQAIIIQCYKNGTNFKDPQFPPIPTSITTDPKADPNIKNATFSRIKSIFNGKQCVLFDQITPSDIMQGGLGICYYLSTLSSLAQKPQRIRQIFKTKSYSNVGAYCLSMYVHGKKTDIVVDDYIPVIPGALQPIFTRPVGNQIWPLILQKAWVKNFGNYTNSEGMSPQQMIGDVCGAPAQGFWLKNYDQQKLFKLIDDFNKKGFIMILSSKRGKVTGIVQGHAYSLIQTFQKDDVKLYKIRNPWGNFQFQGQYSDKSSKWTQQLKSLVGFQNKNDGIFYMTDSQIKLGFQYISVGMDMDGAIRNQLTFQTPFKKQQFFKFSLSKTTQLALQLIQLNSRYLRNNAYKYSPSIFQVVGKSVVFQGDKQGIIFGGKNTHISQNVFETLQADQYIVRVSMFWACQVTNCITLVSYSKQNVKLTQIGQQQGLKKWQNGIINDTMKQQANQMGSIKFYNKWYNMYLSFVFHNLSTKNHNIQVIFNPQQFKNIQYGYGITNNNFKYLLKVGQKKLITFSKIKPNTATSLGEYSYIADPVN